MAFSLPANPPFGINGSDKSLHQTTNGRHDLGDKALPLNGTNVTNGNSHLSTTTNGQASQDTDSNTIPLAPENHIFNVANKALQDCADLLEKIRRVIAQAEDEMAATTAGPLEREQDIEQHAMSSQSQQPVSDRASGHDTHSSPHAMPSAKESLIGMYTKPSLSAPAGTIGKHVRHLADHYKLLFATYPGNRDVEDAQNRPGWTVDYDKRSRDVPMETSIDVAIDVLKSLQNQMREFDSSDSRGEGRVHKPPGLDQPITLMATIDPKYAPVPFQSTLGRELWFCALHAVHHFATIKTICHEFGMDDLGEGFGVAPSTLQHATLKKSTH